MFRRQLPLYNAPSKSNALGFVSGGVGTYKAGLQDNRHERALITASRAPYIDVPQFAAGFPMMMLSDTPAMLSLFPYADASKRWSVVFSNDASISTLSFILATPNRVMPSTSP
jgi:hypothetical protein